MMPDLEDYLLGRVMLRMMMLVAILCFAVVLIGLPSLIGWMIYMAVTGQIHG
jgi:hypothetical protein